MKERNKRIKKHLIQFDSTDHISREKHRARDLRKTSWWKKKIAAGICHYCREKFQPDELTMDHLIPLSRGGSSERFNIVASCKACNNKKKYLLPAEWDEYLEKIKASKTRA